MKNEMMTGKIKIAAAACVAILAVGRLALAAPVIKDWSSSGGRTRNKTSAKDRMYLVKAGDKITFNVTVEGAKKYEWQVNKKKQDKAAVNSLTWTAPNEKGIWEIHLKITGGNKEAHQEWVVSTLPKKEAPNIFDYFADCKSRKRTEEDPWGRPLPEWTGKDKYAPHVSRGMVDSKEGVTWATTPSSVAHGTWKFRFRFPGAIKTCGRQGFGFSFIKASGKDGGNYRFNQSCDSHHHCNIGHGKAYFSIDYDDGVYMLDKWYEATIIRTRDGWLYIYRDDRIEFLAHDEAVKRCESVFLDIRTPDRPQRYFDCLEVYKDKFLFPPKSITFGDYVWNYYCESRKSRPIRKKGIIVKGREVSLAEIASAIKDPKLFTYDAAGKAAVCYTNLVVDEGAELIIKNETLKFHCDSDGVLEFVPKYASRIYIENSTLTSANRHYWVWNNSGSTTHYGYETKLGGGRHPDYYDFVMILAGSCHSSLIIKNSVIDNTAHILFDSPYELDITDTKFTNMREVDIGNYTFKGGYDDAVRDMRIFLKGDKGLWIHTDDMNLDAFRLRNIQFKGKESPLNLTFLINAHRDKLNLYDINAANENIVIKESLAQTYRQSISTYSNAAPYTWKSFLDSGIGLVNCKFKELIIAPGLFTDCEGNPRKKFGAVKYYLDVKVVDAEGNPVPGATVTVTNEIDDANYPPENKKTIKPYAGNPDVVDGGEYCSYYHHRRVVQGLRLASAVTGKDGRTPLPSDEENTLILADYVKKIEDSPRGIRLMWCSHWEDVKYIALDVFDDVHGNILHQVKYTDIKSGDKYHCKVQYQPDGNKIRLIVTDGAGKTAWDTGRTKLKAKIPPYVLDRIDFEVLHKKKHNRGKIFHNNKGFISLSTREYRAEVSAEVDNMRLEVAGKVIEKNDFSRDPQLKELIKDGLECYSLKSTTEGKSFTWEFDISFPKFKVHGPWVAVWLRKAKTSRQVEERTLNYTYEITVEKDGKKKVVKGVNPGPSWYRPDPNKPTHTITVVLKAEKP